MTSERVIDDWKTLPNIDAIMKCITLSSLDDLLEAFKENSLIVMLDDRHPVPAHIEALESHRIYSTSEFHWLFRHNFQEETEETG